MGDLLQKTLASIGELDAAAMSRAQARQNSLAKPAGSLGVLEELSIRLAGIRRGWEKGLEEKVIIVMAGDHGAVEEGVTAYPQEVTQQMLANFVRGGAAINVLARHAGARVVVVDMGTAAQESIEGVLNFKVRQGTGNIARGPAMTREEATAAIEAGIKIAQEEIEKGAQVVGTGDMGIGNTTPSSAILAAFSSLPPEKFVGRGTGVDETGWRRKVGAIYKALEVNAPDPRDPLDVLSKVGGLEIAGIAGCILGAAARRVPAVIDGFISTAGALIAARLQPRAKEFMIASHLSAEPGHRFMLELLGLEPVLRMNLRLGEGTGAALVMPLLDAALKILNEMATFASAGVSEKIER